MIVVDISSKGNRIYDLDHTRVNENATHDQTYDATKDIALRQVHSLEKEQTPNVQRPTSNAQSQNQTAAFSIGR